MEIDIYRGDSVKILNGFREETLSKFLMDLGFGGFCSIVCSIVGKRIPGVLQSMPLSSVPDRQNPALTMVFRTSSHYAPTSHNTDKKTSIPGLTTIWL